MTKKIAIYLPLMVVFLMMFSCIKSDDDNNTGSPTCVITSFSVGDITSDYTSKTVNGADTTYSRTVSGSSIYFNIDQINGVISNVDSLAYWINITKVVPTVVASGTVYYRQKGSGDEFAYLRSGSDSIDFSKGIELMVVSTDGNYSRNYTVSIDKSEYETEKLNWEKVSGSLTLNGEHRTLANNGKLYVFSANDGFPTVTIGTVTGATVDWTSPQYVSAPIYFPSVTLFHGLFYALDDALQLCVSDDGVNWTTTGSTTTIWKLLTADALRLYAYDGENLVSTSDGENWDVETATQLDALPEEPVSGVAYSLSTNKNLQNVVMLGPNSSVGATPVWYKVSATTEESDQNWHYINISDDNSYALPQFDYVQMVRYDGVLLVMGKGSDVTNYANFYVSADNGVTWHIYDDEYSMVAELEGTALPVSMAVCGEGVFLIQSGGNVWRGVK